MPSDEKVVIGLIIGIIAYVAVYVGKGIQKYAIEGLKEDKTIKSKHSGIWFVGLAFTSSYMFVQWFALLFAPINIIAPLEGIGLITLLIFSYYILKEAITKIEVLGVILIIFGTVLITLFNKNPGNIYIWDFSLNNYLLFTIPILIVEGIAVLGSKLLGYKGAGLIIGTTAGTLMAFQTVTKRITALPDPTLLLYFTFIVFAYATMTMLVTQFAFVKAKASLVIPCFTSASISLATIASIFALNEKIVFIQIMGIILVIIGIIFLTAFREEDDKA